MAITQRKGTNSAWGGRREMGKEFELNLKKHTGVDQEKSGGVSHRQRDQRRQRLAYVWKDGGCGQDRGPGQKDNVVQNC